VEPQAADVLVRRCARLPLALRVAAEIVRARPGLPVGELAGELAGRPDALDVLDVHDDPHTAVRAVFSWSYQRLDPDSAKVFRLLGLHHGHDVDLHAVAAMADTAPRETRRALDVLHRAHLVDRSPHGRYRSHDLLRAYAAELAHATDTDADRAAALARLSHHYLAAASAAMDVIAPHETRRRPEVTQPDTIAFHGYDTALRWLDRERANLLATTLHGGPEHVIKVSDTIWRYLSIGGYHDDAIALHTRALHAAQNLGLEAAEANARRVLGAAALRVGLSAHAIDHLDRALALYERTGDHSLQAATLNNIGVAHWRQGDLHRAADRFRDALALYERTGDRRMRAPATNNHARILHTLGRHDEALELFTQALAISRDNGNRTSEANALCGLADVHAEQGDHQRTLDHATEALTVARETGHRTLEGTAMRLIGIAHRGTGHHHQAVDHLDAALRIARSVGDTDQLLSALNALATTHARTGNPTEALRLHEEALTVDTTSGHQDEHAKALVGIADIHATLANHHEATAHYRRALALYRRLGMPQAATVAATLADRTAPATP
ncbi:MAG: tetratricopeptide repeat protein, partial [Saccharothrix sp.]|nr:tetratricopeptide repeat protein [Saccharothrix sp.]